MKDLAYNCWRILKIILAAIGLCISILSVYSWYDTGRLEMLIFCFIAFACTINLLTTKL